MLSSIYTPAVRLLGLLPIVYGAGCYGDKSQLIFDLCCEWLRLFFFLCFGFVDIAIADVDILSKNNSDYFVVINALVHPHYMGTYQSILLHPNLSLCR